jgi:DNA recombination protein RmuC
MVAGCPHIDAVAIQQRSSEVWNLLAAVKTEFGKYGEVLGKVQRKLREASNTIDSAAVRTRAIERKLRDVQELPATDGKGVLMLEAVEGNGEGDGDLNA